MSALLSIDIGGSRLKWAVCEDGRIIDEGVHSSAKGNENITRQIAQLVRQHNLPYGIAIAGDVQDGIIGGAEHLQITNYHPAKELQALGLTPPVICVNDATAACAGESQGYDSLACVVIGTGIGGKLFAGNTVFNGEQGSGGEVGHTVFEKGGLPCACGLRGCSELYGGWAGISSQYQKQAGRTITPSEMLELYQAGDKRVVQIMEQAFDAIAFAGTVLIASVNPQALMVGGGIAAAWGELLREQVQQRTQQLSFAGINTPVHLSQLGQHAPLLGVSRLVQEEVFLQK
jgi:predicted NBD/HSP70 family sugar kinase